VNVGRHLSRVVACLQETPGELVEGERFWARELDGVVELLPAGVILGLFVLMIVPLFAMIALLVVALCGVATLAALTGAVLAMPYLLGHSVLQRLRARRGARRHQALDAHTERTQEITVSTSTPVAAGRPLLAPTGDPGCRTG
jgi:Flp pilus assembly protein TadB